MLTDDTAESLEALRRHGDAMDAALNESEYTPPDPRRVYTAAAPGPFMRCDGPTGCGTVVDDIVKHESWHIVHDSHLAALRDVVLELRRVVEA